MDISIVISPAALAAGQCEGRGSALMVAGDCGRYLSGVLRLPLIGCGCAAAAGPVGNGVASLTYPTDRHPSALRRRSARVAIYQVPEAGRLSTTVACLTPMQRAEHSNAHR